MVDLFRLAKPRGSGIPHFRNPRKIYYSLVKLDVRYARKSPKKNKKKTTNHDHKKITIENHHVCHLFYGPCSIKNWLNNMFVWISEEKSTENWWTKLCTTAVDLWTPNQARTEYE